MSVISALVRICVRVGVAPVHLTRLIVARVGGTWRIPSRARDFARLRLLTYLRECSAIIRPTEAFRHGVFGKYRAAADVDECILDFWMTFGVPQSGCIYGASAFHRLIWKLLLYG